MTSFFRRRDKKSRLK